MLPATYTHAMNARVMILLPAYNEGSRIGTVIAGIRSVFAEADMTVVDDGSGDDTGLQALKAGATVLTLPFNLGYGVALQAGYKHALREGYKYVVQMDADGQHDPGSIPAVLGPVAEDRCDLCIGSRFLEGKSYPIPPGRRLGMAILRRVASRLTGRTVTDPTSGFQAMNRRVLEFYARDSFPVDYPDVDVLVMLHHHGFRVLEVPVTMHPRTSGMSLHSGLKPVYYLFKMGVDIPLNLLRREK
ncbi:MAG: glycosyltransferase family 2 protein [Candidatus Hydrogenedentes bacterium]|nr:glycosyltransferase family 2 protein [Candidatus Hydrogenedentota bacterium]